MITETIIWTALPGGIAGNNLKLSLFVSPRLTTGGGNGQLSQAPAFFEWARHAATLSFKVDFDGGPKPTAAVSSTPSLDAWSKVFPGTTLVKGHVFKDLSARPTFSYPVKSLHDHVHTLYKTIANDPASLVDHPDLANRQGPLGRHLFELGKLGDVIARLSGLGPRSKGERQVVTPGDFEQLMPSPVGTPPGTPPVVDYLKAWAFYNRKVFRTPSPQDDELSPLLKPRDDIDFHEAVAMLADHPSVLRLLGLVIDCTVPLSADIPKTGRVRVSDLSFGDAPSTAPTSHTPWTRYRIDAFGFLPAPRPGSDVAGGMLFLGDKSRFQVIEVDNDGATLKTLDHALNITRQLAVSKGTTKPKDTTLPSLRSGGFSIVRHNRQTAMKARFANQAALNTNPGAAELWAEDLTRGYRVDVLYNEKWHSLCRRRGKVTVGGASKLELPIADEGFVQGSGATSASEKPANPMQDVLFVHEALFGWSGWSLVAARPGRTITFEHQDSINKKQRAYVDRTANTPATAFQVSQDVHAEPKSLPRLRFGEPYRFRARAVDMAGNSFPWDVDLPADFWRSDEVLYLRYEPVAPPTLVPRAIFREGESLEHLTIRSQVGPYGLPAEVFNPTNDRHVVPPKTAQETAEQHGMLDKLMATDPALAFRISAKEQGTLVDREIVDPYDDSVKPYKTVPVASIALGWHESVPPAQRDQWPAKKGDPLLPGQYVMHTGETLALPYLPDPLSHGIVIWNPEDGSFVRRAFDGTWPDHAPHRLILSEGAGWGATGEGLSIKLPKATILTLRYASMVDADGLEIHAWGKNLTGQARSLALASRHWMVSPWREITLVHAVERPMEEPKVLQLGASKGLGETFAGLRGVIGSHSRSTGEADVRSEWEEPADRLTDPGPTTDKHEAHVFNRRIAYDENQAPFPHTTGADGKLAEIRHEFGDTKHRWVKYQAVGTTRYREYFSPAITGDKKNITLAGPLTDRVNILSSARPDVPRVLYTVPTFKWEGAPNQSRRIGRGLRIYLDRPWYSSGEDELLAVMLAPSSPIPENLRPYVSQWGADPVWNRPGPSSALQPHHFENGTAYGQVGLAENGGSVIPVGFKPEYNPERQLWFVDVVMKPGNTYYPYVRFALARYQPHSVLNAHLSRVVRTEFAQLVADRTATLSFTRAGIVDVMVSGLTAWNETGIPVPVIFGQVDTGNVPAALAKAPQLNQVLDAPGKLPPPVFEQPPVVLPIPQYTKNTSAGRSHVVRAVIEARPLGHKGDLGWEAASDEVTLESYTRSGSPDVFWRGALKTPVADDRELRMLVREYEQFWADATNPNAARVIGERLVYVDMLPFEV